MGDELEHAGSADATDDPRERHMHHGLHRPPWKRVVLTLLGFVLTVVGIALWLTPIAPGGFLAYIGIPLLFAASPRHEARMRRWVTYRINRLRAKLRRWERRRSERRRAARGPGEGSRSQAGRAESSRAAGPSIRSGGADPGAHPGPAGSGRAQGDENT